MAKNGNGNNGRTKRTGAPQTEFQRGFMEGYDQGLSECGPLAGVTRYFERGKKRGKIAAKHEAIKRKAAEEAMKRHEVQRAAERKAGLAALETLNPGDGKVVLRSSYMDWPYEIVQRKDGLYDGWIEGDKLAASSMDSKAKVVDRIKKSVRAYQREGDIPRHKYTTWERLMGRKRPELSYEDIKQIQREEGLRNPRRKRGKMPAADLPPPIPGLEGPFRYRTGFILYWDPKEGKYYDRGSDVYLTTKEAEAAMGTKSPKRNSARLWALPDLSIDEQHALEGATQAPFLGRKDFSSLHGKAVYDKLRRLKLITLKGGEVHVTPEGQHLALASHRRRESSQYDNPKWITRPGKLGGKGFLSKPRATQKKILDKCEGKYGYRSCLGSIMVLERSRAIKAKHGRTLATLRRYLVGKYGGALAHAAARVALGNPKAGEFTLVPEITGCEACRIKTNPAFEADMRALERELAGAQWESERKPPKEPKSKKKNPDAARAALRKAMRGT